MNLTENNEKDNFCLTLNLERQGEILKEGNILSFTWKLAKIVVGILGPTHKHFVSTISTHYSLKEKIELQSKSDVHEVFYFSHLDFDCTHDSSHEGFWSSIGVCMLQTRVLM